MHRKNLSFIGVSIVLVGICIFALSYYMFFTTKGSASLACFVLGRYVKSQSIDFAKVEGTLRAKLSLHDVLVENAKKLPPGAVIKVQRIDFTLKEPRLSRLSLDVYNGRLKLPFSDTILFYGAYDRGQLDLNVYSKKVSAREIMDLFTHRRFLSTVSGVFSDVNLHITGAMSELAMEGKFFIDKIIKENFSITGCLGSVMMYCDDLFEAMTLNGEIVFKSGTASGGNTAVINLDASKIVYESDPKRPKFNIRGHSTVEDIKISVILQGNVDSPKLRLSSYPPLTQGILLVMLATGRSWGGHSMGLGQDKISANLVKDFVDYFIFAGKGTQIARHLGISDISLTFDKATKGVGVKTSIVDTVQVSYEVEPPKEGQNDGIPKHTVGGQLKITDTVSVAVEKELKQKTTEEIVDDELESEEKVYLQFKKQF